MCLSKWIVSWLRWITAAGVLLSATTFVRALTLGNEVAAVGDLDGWNAILVVDETTTYTNSTGVRETVTLDRFRVQVGAVRGRLTPFVVRVTGDNRFTVMAVGSTRVAGADFTATGVRSFPFSESPTQFDLGPGDRLAGGFTDAAPDGSGNAGSVVPFVDGGNEIWLTGGPATGNSGTVAVGRSPTAGAEIFTTLTRQYQFQITFDAHVAGPVAPTDLRFDPLALFPGNVDVEVGLLTTVDPNATDTHTYTIVADAANVFALVGDRLRFRGPAGPEGTPYTVRVRTSDPADLTLEEDFTILVAVPLPPSAVRCTTDRLMAGSAPGTLLGRLVTEDGNPGDRFDYTLAAGPGDDDNAMVTVAGEELHLAQTAPQVGTVLRLRVRSTDRAGLWVEDTLALSVVEVAVRINEVLARNAGGLADEDGDHPDWIELHNPLGIPVDLTGWRLTDDPAEPARWIFPTVSLPADGYLVVFASGKNRAAPGTPLHTSFRLDGAQETLVLSRPDTVIADRRPLQESAPDISVGEGTTGGWGYLVPTPGLPNGPTFPFGINDVAFSVPRGFLDSVQMLTLVPTVPGSVVRYTTDGSAPSASHGTLYSDPISLAPDRSASTRGTRRIRALALHPQAVAGREATHTYLFVHGGAEPALDAVTRQSNTNNRRQTEAIRNHPVYSGILDEALLDLPAIAITTSGGLPTTGEREAVIEFFHPGGPSVEPGFQIRCGIQAVGNASLASPKNNFRLYFRGRYGESSLDYPLFRDQPHGPHSAVSRFNRLSLRSGSHDSFHWLAETANPPPPGTPSDALYLRNIVMDDLHLAMGHLAPHGRFAHCFVNGAYHGLYQLREYPNDDFLASYLGGPASGYEFTNAANPAENGTPGWAAVWAEIHRLAATDYAACARWVDMAQLADFMVLNFWAGNNWDWNPNQNWMAAGPNGPAAGGWQFFSYDNDIIWMSERADVVTRGVPDGLFDQLMGHEEFRVLFRDRFYRHCFHDGVLTAGRATEALDRRAAEIEQAIVAETARWQPGTAMALPWDRDGEWRAELDRIRNRFFPSRVSVLLGQIVRQGWYPLAAPELEPHGGVIPRATAPAIQGPPSATLYATLDGTDPRLPGGAVSPSAFVISTQPAPELMVEGPMRLRMRARRGTIWSPLNGADFSPFPLIPAGPSNLVVSEIHYHPSEGGVEFLELMNIADVAVDLGGAFFTRGLEAVIPLGTILPPGGRYVLNEAAFGGGTSLSNGGERLTLVARDGATVIRDFTYGDQMPWPEAPDGKGPSLVLLNPKAAGSDAWHADPAHWRSSLNDGGTPGGTDSLSFPDGVMPEIDADGDGRTALEEYAFGTRDTDPASLPSPFEFHPDPESPGAYRLTLHRSALAEDALIVIERSPSLAQAPWTAEGIEFLSAVQARPVLREIWRIHPPASSDRCFLRLRLTRL